MSVELVPSSQLGFHRTSSPLPLSVMAGYKRMLTARRSQCGHTVKKYANDIGPLTTLVKRTLTVANPNSQPIAFKVKTTAPKAFCVRPNSGRIEPGERVEVQGEGRQEQRHDLGRR